MRLLFAPAGEDQENALPESEELREDALMLVNIILMVISTTIITTMIGTTTIITTTIIVIWVL